MIMSPSPEMYKYLKNDGNKTIVVKEAPKHIKDEARGVNKIALEYEGKEYYTIEE